MIADLTSDMCAVIERIGNKSATAYEMGVNGVVMKRLWELGFLRMDYAREGECPPWYSLSEKGEGAAAVLTATLVPCDREGPVTHIKRIVAEHYRIPVSEMVSERRSRSVARPRQVAMYLSKRLTPKSLPDIGRHFGNRDHTTVLHAVRKVTSLMDEDHNFKDEVTTLKSKLVSDVSPSVVENSHKGAFFTSSVGA